MIIKSAGGFSGTSGKIPSRPIPSAGTSARKAYNKTMSQGTGAPQSINQRLTGTYNYPAKPTISKLVDTISPKPSTKRNRTSGGYSSFSSGGYSGDFSLPVLSSAKESFDYYEAPIAEKYGFSKTTAYQEALANTAYRREMEDMRKAGLNPSVIYGSHNTSGADSNILPRDDFAYLDYGDYGGYSGSHGGKSGYRSRSRGNSGKYLFSGGSYYGIMAGVGAITAIATRNVGAGMAAAGIAGTAMKALNGFLKK